ncbi:hypothetical protein WA158_004424 [Blastocystis sp. Blastoise]
MGRKKREQIKEDFWCYYCEREFENEKTLMTHQSARHFKCSTCHKKLNDLDGLINHIANIHKGTISEVPNAIKGREGIKMFVFGMTGIPKELKIAHYAKKYGVDPKNLPSSILQLVNDSTSTVDMSNQKELDDALLKKLSATQTPMMPAIPTAATSIPWTPTPYAAPGFVQQPMAPFQQPYMVPGYGYAPNMYMPPNPYGAPVRPSMPPTIPPMTSPLPNPLANPFTTSPTTPVTPTPSIPIPSIPNTTSNNNTTSPTINMTTLPISSLTPSSIPATTPTIPAKQPTIITEPGKKPYQLIYDKEDMCMEEYRASFSKYMYAENTVLKALKELEDESTNVLSKYLS